MSDVRLWFDESWQRAKRDAVGISEKSGRKSNRRGKRGEKEQERNDEDTSKAGDVVSRRSA